MSNLGSFAPPSEYELEDLEDLPSDPDPSPPVVWVDDNRLFAVDKLPTDLVPPQINLTGESPINLQEQQEYPRPTESSGAPRVLRVETNNSGIRGPHLQEPRLQEPRLSSLNLNRQDQCQHRCINHRKRSQNSPFTRLGMCWITSNWSAA